ncbi:hypothetical protein AAG570_002005 [Ranatra chinensis]|uniref:CHCH domain-containing protein n=1 Tax=Ranatra chinensis TaxID=642074 RepID=A0ABD0YA72_9HEMI
MRKLTRLGYVRRGGYVLPENVPFQELLPLKLRNQVSAKGSTKGGAACIQEMSVLFACLKKNDFKDNLCSQEITKFYNCYQSYEEAKRAQNEREKRGELSPGEKRLSHAQANLLIKKYPLKS